MKRATLRNGILFFLTALSVVLLNGCASRDAPVELTGEFDKVRESAPAYCSDFCVEELECQLSVYALSELAGVKDFSESVELGEFESDVKGRMLDDCVVRCAWQATQGTVVTDENWNKVTGRIDTTVVSEIPGDKIARFEQCYWDFGKPECIYYPEINDPNDYSEEELLFTIFDLRDEQQCNDMDQCYEILKPDVRVTCDWDGQRCVNGGSMFGSWDVGLKSFFWDSPWDLSFHGGLHFQPLEG